MHIKNILIRIAFTFLKESGKDGTNENFAKDWNKFGFSFGGYFIYFVDQDFDSGGTKSVF